MPVYSFGETLTSLHSTLITKARKIMTFISLKNIKIIRVLPGLCDSETKLTYNYITYFSYWKMQCQTTNII